MRLKTKMTVELTMYDEVEERQVQGELFFHIPIPQWLL